MNIRAKGFGQQVPHPELEKTADQGESGTGVENALQELNLVWIQDLVISTATYFFYMGVEFTGS